MLKKMKTSGEMKNIKVFNSVLLNTQIKQKLIEGTKFDIL